MSTQRVGTMNFGPSMKINLNEYSEFNHQEFVQHAIDLRKKKGLHSEFWYVLDDLVDKIKQFKEKYSVRLF